MSKVSEKIDSKRAKKKSNNKKSKTKNLRVKNKDLDVKVSQIVDQEIADFKKIPRKHIDTLLAKIVVPETKKNYAKTKYQNFYSNKKKLNDEETSSVDFESSLDDEVQQHLQSLQPDDETPEEETILNNETLDVDARDLVEPENDANNNEIPNSEEDFSHEIDETTNSNNTNGSNHVTENDNETIENQETTTINKIDQDIVGLVQEIEEESMKKNHLLAFGKSSNR